MGSARTRFSGLFRSALAAGAICIAVTQSGQTTSTAYIGGVATVATTTNCTNSSTVERYLLKDHLGSLDVMTDASGPVLQRYSFDTPLLARGDSRSESLPHAHATSSSTARMRVGIRSVG